MWHVSVSIWNAFTHRPKILSVWQKADFEKAKRYAELTLEGVGRFGNDVEQRGDIAMHFRRQTNEIEAASVMKTPRWRSKYGKK